MEKESKRYSPIILAFAGGLILSGGWLLAPFPILIFFGLAPLFALTDREIPASAAWEKMEWVLLALVASFLACHHFDFNYIVSSLVLAILFTLPFVGYLWVRNTLGIRVGKITIILFWLALEYILLKINSASNVFLADALQLKPEWTPWNVHTGYLGASLLILLTNLMVYQALLSPKPMEWYWILAAFIFVLAPTVSNYFIDSNSLTRMDMLNVYSGNSTSSNLTYLARGEFVVRTSMWISTLILLFTLVKSQTRRG